MILSVNDHNRFFEGFEYVYPVVSRRAGGLSLGINLNINNACNWRCIYCQVPGLVRGAPPAVDLAVLEQELDTFIHKIQKDDYLVKNLPEGMQRFNDIAFSGNGEPTSAPNFQGVVEVVRRVREKRAVADDVKTVVITNGSLVHQEAVRETLQDLCEMNGEIWFKLDRASKEGVSIVNDVAFSKKRVIDNLRLSADTCPTWIQTCVFDIDGAPPKDDEVQAYIDFLSLVMSQNIPVKGILLYSIARQSHQPEASRLSKPSSIWISHLTQKIRDLGLTVKYSS